MCFSTSKDGGLATPILGLTSLIFFLLAEVASENYIFELVDGISNGLSGDDRLTELPLGLPGY